MRNFCFEDARATLTRLKTSREGLGGAEAQRRLRENGPNRIQGAKRNSPVRLFFMQFGDFMTVLLIAAAAISGFIAFLSRERSGLTDTFIILGIIFLNALVGTVQQFRADRAIENLKKLSAGVCKVRREGSVIKIPCEELVLGDIVLLEEGDVVPADMRIIEEHGLKCDEAALTGESVSVEKCAEPLPAGKISLGNMRNCLFSSTYVVGGNCMAVVTAVGGDTEMGKIAEMLKDGKPEPTPLERSLSTLGKAITAFVIAVSAVIFLLGIFVRGDGVLKNFMTAVAVAVAAIPEGLPAAVTIIMAMGVRRMSEKKVAIRKLKAVETLGGCTVICTDKTGTLTQNKMTVTSTYCSAGGQNRLLQCMAVCCTVKGQKGAYMGDPTEIALKNYADALNFAQPFEKLAEIPFTSERKMMTTAARIGGEELSFTKGAPDVLIKKCAYILGAEGIERLTAERRAEIAAESDRLGGEGLRVLGFAFKRFGPQQEEEMVFIGLAGLADGLKRGVKQAVAECKSAGITTVMITGDHVKTAFCVAKKLKIAQSESEVVTGEELDGLKGREREKRILGGRVFARVSPKHKNMIVKCLKKHGEVVAMTGDGINDAPGIKSADIGVSMGIYGTDVTKSASDMVIMDDNFATIVAAVREGRRISSNIKKTIRFFVSTNLAEVLAIFAASVFLFRYDFLLSTQLLWLNLITDSFPVLALGTEKEEGDIMSRPPERAEAGLFCKSSVAGMAIGGAYMAAVVLGVFVLFLNLWGNGAATTAAFLTISFMELFHAFNIRRERASAFGDLFGNKILLATVAAGIAVNVLLCATPLAGAFSLVNLGGAQWAIVFGAALSVIPVYEIYKFILRRMSK